MPAAHFLGLRPRLVFAQYPDDLLLAEATPFHRPSPFSGDGLYLISAEFSGCRAEATKEERERNQLEIVARDNALAKAHKDLAEARDAELEVRRQRKALEDEKHAFELEVARKIDDERQKIREK